MKIIPAIEDFMVKELFRHEEVRKQFVSDVLGIPIEEIKSVRILNPFLRKRHKKHKQGILDILLELNDNTKIDVEIQVKSQKFWNKRNLYYLAKMYTDELYVGQHYEKLKKCVSISILDFDLLDGEENHRVFTLKDRSGRELTDLFEVHIIELKKQMTYDTPVNDWIRLFNARDEGDFAMIKRKTRGIQEAMEVVKQMSLRKRLRWEFEQLQKERRDKYAQDEYIRDQGRLEGRQEGIQEGMQKGRQEGIQEHALQVYQNCLDRGMPEEEAIAISGVGQK